MKLIKALNGTFGPFTEVKTLDDRYEADGIHYQFDVIGAASIIDCPPDHVAPITPVAPRKMVPLDFFALFTESEQLTIAQAATQNAAILLWFHKASGATQIDLDDPQLVTGLAALVGAGLLAEGRRDQILTGVRPA